MPKDDLPPGSEFSPAPEQIGDRLPELLRLIKRSAGPREQVERALIAEFYPSSTPKVQKNLYLALRGYRIVTEGDDGNVGLSDVGERLLAKAGSEREMYAELARHMISELHGGDFLDVVDELQKRGEAPELEPIAEALTARGVRTSASSRNMSSLRGWLAKAGIVTPPKTPLEVHWDQYERIMGGERDEIEGVRALGPEQKAFALALAKASPDKPVRSKEIMELAESSYGVRFPSKTAPKAVLEGIERAGLIRLLRPPGGGRQSGKSMMVEATAKLRSDVLKPLLQQMQRGPTLPPRRYLTMPWTDLLKLIGTGNVQERGVALEALAVRVAWLLNLRLVAWRARGRQTGYAEVDALFEDLGKSTARWQVQCKAGDLDSDAVHRELGVAQLTKASVILLVTNGAVTRTAKAGIREANRRSNLCVMQLDASDLAQVAASPASVAKLVRNRAEEAADDKRLPDEEALE